MFKIWQIFVFSLVPLALVFIGVIGGSIHGNDSRKEVFNPPPPARSPLPGGGPTTPGGGGGPGAATLQIVTKDLKFNVRSLTAPPNARVTVVMDNQDAGVVHNFSVYRDSRATAPMSPDSVNTDLFLGPGSHPYSFTTPGPASYYFRCDVHPDTANGSFIVR